MTSVGLTRPRPWAARRLLVGFLPPALVFVGVLVAWELLVVGAGIQRFLLPAPSDILASLETNWDELRQAAVATVFEAIGGLVIGVLVGIVVALLTARWRTGRRGIMPFAIMASAIPTIAVAPIMNNWFGSENPASKMAIVALLVFFPTVLNVVRGLTTVDPALLEYMRTLNAGETAVFLKVRIPNAVPYFFTALRIATPLSLIGAIIAEYFGGPELVLGVWILHQAALFLFADAWAAIALACAVGIVLYLGVLVAEWLAMPWARGRTHR